jgi:hypothetical protein
MSFHLNSKIDKYIGRYSYLGFAAIIEQFENKLIVKAFGRSAHELVEVSNNTYHIKDLSGYEISFNETDGKVTGAKIKMPNGLNYKVNKIE